MVSRNMLTNVVFSIINIFIFYLLAKLLLLCAGLAFTVDQQTKSATTVFFLLGGVLYSLYVIYKNREKS